MNDHPHVQHPRALLPDRSGRLVARINDWTTDHLALALGSVIGMWLSFAIPLLAFEIPLLLKLIGLVSSYWIQLWALFVLQRSANRADVKRDAKANVDHAAQTHIANTVDQILTNQTGASS